MFSYVKKLSLPVQLVLVIMGVLVCGDMLPFSIVKGLYTFSVVFKELLCVFLPFIIFFVVLSGILSLKENAPLVLLVLLCLIFISNFCVALSMYAIVICVMPFLAYAAPGDQLVGDTGAILEPFFMLNAPVLIRSEIALLMAIIVGLFFSWFSSARFEQYIVKTKRLIEMFLLCCFIPLLPLYVSGFLLKLRYEGMLVTLIQNYGVTFFLIVTLQLVYLALLYFGMFGFSYRNAQRALINALPAYLTGFGTMSSVLTIPVSIECAVENGTNRSLANIAMPIMANVHLLGDAVCTPLLTLVTICLFYGHVPTFIHFLSFVLYFCAALFAVSGIPGGGILVMIPVLISVFNFTPEMISIVTTIYFLMDSFGTAANVMGDGALVMGVQKIVQRFVSKN